MKVQMKYLQGGDRILLTVAFYVNNNDYVGKKY